MTTTYLPNLPVEILHHIFHYCDAQTIFLNVAAVCKRLRAVVYQYNEVLLKFDWSWRFTSNGNRTLSFVPYHAVKSLILLSDAVNGMENKNRSFIFDILRFEQLRHLSLLEIEYTNLQLLLKNWNYQHLVTLEIHIKNMLPTETVSLLTSITAKLNTLQKFSWISSNHGIKNIEWLDQCKVTHLTISDRLRFSEYLAILDHLSSLKTLQVNAFSMDNNAMYVLPVSNGSVTSQLTCLIIQDCSLSTEHIKLLVSKTIALRRLKLTFALKKFESIIDIYHWEEFVRTELNFLNRLEFCLSYNLPSNDMICLESFINPFQQPFWLNEKRWFVACEYFHDTSHTISLHTMSNTYRFYQDRYPGLQRGILFKRNNYYITEYLRGEYNNTVACNTLIELNLYGNGFNVLGAQYLARALENNQTLVELNLNSNKIKTIGTQYIINALKKSTTLTTLYLRCNNIDDEGAQCISTFLRDNKTLTFLQLACNEIGSTGIQHLGQALQHNQTLSTLDLSQNSVDEDGAKHIANMLQVNKALKELDISLSKIKDKAMILLCEGLRNNITLKRIDLGLNRIGNRGAESLAEVLQNMTALETINLERNAIEDNGAQSLALALRKNTTVTKLNLYANKIGRRGAEQLIHELRDNTTLLDLSLKGNEKNGYCAAVETYIKIKKDSSLTKISARYHEIDEAGMRLIATALEQNTTLRELDLCDNRINAKGTKYLADILRTNTTLEILNLANNCIEIEGVNYLAQALQDNPTQTLTTLYLGRYDHSMQNMASPLRDSKILPISDRKTSFDGYLTALKAAVDMRNDKTLDTLNLECRHVGCIGIQHITDALQHNTTLKILDLRANDIGPEGAKYVADILRTNTTLETLNLADNSIEIEGVNYLAQALQDNPTQTLTTLYLGRTHNRKHSSKLFYQQNMAFTLRQAKILSGENLKGTYDEYLNGMQIAVMMHTDQLKTELDLTGRHFGSIGAQFIADALSVNTTLKILRINVDRIGGRIGFQYFTDQLEDETRQLVLYLSRSSHKTTTFIDIVNKLRNDKTLTTLTIENGPIFQEGLRYILHALCQHPTTLTTLKLINNNLNRELQANLVEIIRNNTMLTTLSVEKNEINDENMAYLASVLQNHRALRILTLSRNKIESSGIKYLVDTIQNNTMLSILTVKNNPIGDQGAEYLANMLLLNRTLVEIDLTNNQIEDDGVGCIADALITNNTLLKLNLETNEIGVLGAKYIGNALEKNTTLVTLQLNRNKIKADGTRYLAHALSINNTLKKLTLTNNRIGENGVRYLIESLQNNHTLIELDVGFNGIDKQMRECINNILQNKSKSTE